MNYLLLMALVASPPVRLVVGLDGADLRRTDATTRIEALLRDVNGVHVRRLPHALVVDVPDRAAAVLRLAARHDVRWIEDDLFFPVALKAVPDDTHYAEQWPLHQTPGAAPQTAIGVEAAWDETRGTDAAGFNTVVAIIDDGFDLLHPDLATRFRADGLDLAQDPPDDDPSAAARDNHGTQTAGVVAATGFNGLGVSGVCPSCAILPIRLIGGGGPADLYTSGSAAAYAIVWAVDHGAAVINNSWGPPDGNRFDPFHPVTPWPIPSVLADALQYAATQGRGGLGTLVTWSAGNGAELATYDGFASDPRVIAVGAVDATGRQAYYSDYGPTVRLVAPSSGGSPLPKVWTTDRSGDDGVGPGDYTAEYSGTSAAAAMVAGVAALVATRYPELTAAQIMEALFDGAFRIDPERGQYDNGRSRLYGYGRVDAAAALIIASSYTDDGCTVWLDVCDNGLDDDCDGEVDDVDQCTSCWPDEMSEVCDGYDNNCDGRVDELFVCQGSDRPVCAPCADSQQCALGSRCRTSSDFPGTWCFAECLDGQSCTPGFSCDGEVCVLQISSDVISCFDLLRCGQPERCDRIDNDCNGIVDDISPDTVEWLVATRDCGRDGVCAGRAAVCAGGRWLCDRSDDWQEIETRCDGLDNDCDGFVDDHAICAAKLQRLQGDARRGCSGTGMTPWLVLALLALPVGARRR